MEALTELDLEAAPHFRSQLPELQKLNACVAAVNELVTDKRFDSLAPGADSLTYEELASVLRLGSRSKTFILLMLHCGRLRALDSSRPGGTNSTSGARYRVAGGSTR
mgnify:CR=1 FL=1